MQLLKKPRQPKSRPFVAYILGQEIHEEWKHFVHFSHEEVAVEIIGAKSGPVKKEMAEVG